MQLHIEDIFARKAKCSDNDTSLADVLERDIATSFAGGNKFIYELLQNADDAGKNSNVEVLFKLFEFAGDNYLLFSHTGGGFEEGDVNKITSYANQRVEEKTIDPNKIGYKGIGFKAIFTIARSVVIFSKGYQFRFDSEYEKWRESGKGEAYPWQIIPIWTEVNELPEPVRVSMTNNINVNFLVKIKPKNNIKSAMEFLQNNTRILLFLRRVRKLTIAFSEKSQTKIESRHRPEGQCDILLDGKPYRSWLIKSYNLKIPPQISEILSDMSSHACPERLKKADSVTITFAGLLEKGQLVHSANLAVYCYLPTQVDCGLPFVINGDFLLDPARAYLADNKWNEFLMGSFAQKQFEWLAELSSSDNYRLQVLNVLSHNALTSLSPGISASFRKEYDKASKSIAFIPGDVAQNPILLSKALIDETNFYTVFPELTPPNTSKRLVHPQLENLKILHKIGVEKISFKDLVKSIEIHANENKNPEFQIRLIKFIWQHEKKFDASAFKAKKFLLSQDGTVLEPSQLYFPSQGSVAEFSGYKGLKFLHNRIISAFAEDKRILQWLKDLGVNNSSPLQILRGYVFDLIKKNEITQNNVVELTRFAMHVARDNKVTTADWEMLSCMPILTESGLLQKPFDLYLPDLLRPLIPLQEVMQNKSIYVSRAYYSDIHAGVRDYEMQSWQQYFIKVGVHADIRFVSEEVSIEKGDQQLAFFLKYRTFLKTTGKTSSTIKPYHRILHLVYAPLMKHLTTNPSFAKIFVQRLLEQWRTISSGYQSCYRDGNSQGKDLNVSYLQFVFQTEACFPGFDGKLYKTTDLYDRSFEALSEYDRSLVTTDKDLDLTPPQIEFFKIKNQLSFDQCVNLLKRFKDEIELICFVIVWRQLLQMESDLSDDQRTKLLSLNILLPNSNHRLCPRDQIACFAVPGEDPPLHSDKFLLHFNDFTQAEMVRIARLLGVKVLGERVRILDFDGKEPVPDLKTSSFFCEPIIKESSWSYLSLAVWLEHRRRTLNAQSLWDTIIAKFIQLKFYRVERLSYHFGDKSDTVVNVQVCLDETKIYYVRDWKRKPLRLAEFLKLLGSYLVISESTLFELERLILALNRNEDPREYLSAWHLPAHPNVKQIFPESVKPQEPTPEGNGAGQSQENFGNEKDIFANAFEDETSDDNFQQGEETEEDSYELATPPSGSIKRPSTSVNTPLRKSETSSASSQRKPVVENEGIRLVDVEQFDYEQLFKIQEANLTVRQSSTTKVKVSVELFESGSAKQRRPNDASNEADEANHSNADTVPRETDSPRSPKFFEPSAKPALTKADKDRIGRCGERMIYLRQRYRYEKKYPKCTIIEKANGFQVLGQDHQDKPVDIKVVWHNMDAKRDEDRDITIVKATGKRYLEVKATTTDKPEFNWTAREVALAKRKGDRYKLFHIVSMSSNPIVTKIKNPAAKLGAEMQIIGYRVKF